MKFFTWLKVKQSEVTAQNIGICTKKLEIRDP